VTLQTQIHFVSGKGGVGKSAISCALALHFRAQGHRTLLAQIHAADSHGPMLELEPIGPEMDEVEEDLFAVNIDPTQALREYVLLKVKLEVLYKAAVENRLVQRFLRFVPSLQELNMLGKLWYHAEEKRDGGAPRFDRIVVDCPSTGHGLGFLRVSQVVRDVVRTGPIAVESAHMAQTFEDPARTRLHVVTIPEDMPTNETYEFVRRARDTHVAPLGYVFINGVLESAFTHDERVMLQGLDLPARAEGGTQARVELARAVARRCERDHLLEVQRERLHAPELGLPTVELPMLLGPRFARSELMRLVDCIEAAA
jgi:anion-transporting  ArsA/GET3 family ATPase